MNLVGKDVELPSLINEDLDKLDMATKTKVDFVALYMKDGQVVYAFNCGSGVARIESDRTYNDGNWYKVGLRI